MHEAFARHRVAAIGRELPSGLDPRPARDMNDDGQAINGQRFVLGNDSIEIVIHQGAFASHPATIQFHHPPIVRTPVEIARHALALEGPARNPPLAIQLWSVGGTYEIRSGRAYGAINAEEQAIDGQRSAFADDSVEFAIHQGAFTSHPAIIPFHHRPIVRAPVEIARHALGMEGPAGKIVAANRRRVPATVFFQDGTKTASWIVLTPFRPCGCAGCSSATYSEKVRFRGVHSGLPSKAGASSFYSSGTREFETLR